MFSGNQEDSKIQIKQDDKFFSRLLSKETAICNSSFRVYYGGATGAVPFLWESQPGTPKNKFCDTSLPPLTPPPSYQTSTRKDTSIKKPSKFKLIHTIFPRLSVKKSHVTPTSSSSVSSSSSWSSSMSSPPSTPITPKVHRRHPSSLSSFDSRGDDHDEESSLGSPTSILCFGLGRASSSGGAGGLRSCYSLVR